MKNILFILAAAAILASCSGKGNSSSLSTDSEDQKPIQAFSTTGIAIDGAMNSILLRTHEGDTVTFAYPYLNTADRLGWLIGDTVTVTYLKIDGRDSVLCLRKGTLSNK